VRKQQKTLGGYFILPHLVQSLQPMQWESLFQNINLNSEHKSTNRQRTGMHGNQHSLLSLRRGRVWRSRYTASPLPTSLTRACHRAATTRLPSTQNGKISESLIRWSNRLCCSGCLSTDGLSVLTIHDSQPAKESHCQWVGPSAAAFGWSRHWSVASPASMRHPAARRRHFDVKLWDVIF